MTFRVVFALERVKHLRSEVCEQNQHVQDAVRSQSRRDGKVTSRGDDFILLQQRPSGKLRPGER
jgi:hypothetical protein